MLFHLRLLSVLGVAVDRGPAGKVRGCHSRAPPLQVASGLLFQPLFARPTTFMRGNAHCRVRDRPANHLSGRPAMFGSSLLLVFFVPAPFRRHYLDGALGVVNTAGLVRVTGTRPSVISNANVASGSRKGWSQGPRFLNAVHMSGGGVGCELRWSRTALAR